MATGNLSSQCTCSLLLNSMSVEWFAGNVVAVFALIVMQLSSAEAEVCDRQLLAVGKIRCSLCCCQGNADIVERRCNLSSFFLVLIEHQRRCRLHDGFRSGTGYGFSLCPESLLLAVSDFW